MASTMSASKTQTPLLLRASMSTIEVKGPIDMFKSRYKYLVRVNQDGQKILEGTGASLSQETGEFRIKWDINKELLFALSSTIKLSVHGKGLRGHDLGEFEGKVVDLVENENYFDLVAEGKDTSLMLRITISQLDTKTHTTDYVKEVMTKVDGELAAMGTLSLPDRDNGGVKFVMGQILQSTKNIMDKVADAHPFLKVAWSALAFVYEAVEKTTLEDKAVHDLAKSLREILGVASARTDLLIIKDTTDVIAEMSLLALRIAQVIHEYSSTGIIGRTVRGNLTTSLHSRIQQYQADYRELMEQFRTRLGINVDVQVEKVYQMVLELKTIGGGSEAQTSARLFRPIATTRFIGRQKEIELLKAHFELRDTTGARRRDTSGARRSLLVSGMGGIGKTQLCLQFVEDAMDNSTFSRVFYVDAATEESIASSFKGIFHNTQGLKSSGLSESPDSVLAWISRLDEDWLIVYDNAEESVAKYLPGGRRGNILMTSRNPGLARHTGGAHIALDEMSEEDALALFKSSGCREFLSPEDERLSREIVSSLSFIPLAVDLAGAYTASSSGFCDLHEYLELLSVKRTQVLNPLSIADATPYNNTVYGAWELFMKGLEDMAASSRPRQEAAQSALAILQIFSFFHHSNINESIFKRAAVAYHTASAHENDFFRPPMLSSVAQKILQLDGTKNDWDNEYFRKGIQTLLSASLIKKSAMSERVVYSVHPLIHEWVRNKHIPHGQALSQDAHIIMLSSISFDVVLYQQTITPLLPHIKAYLQYTLDITPSNSGYNDYILERLHFFYNKASLLNEEKNILPVLNQHRKQALGDKHPKTLAIMKEVGTWYSRQGKKEDALSTLNNTLSLMKEVYGDRGQITLDTMKEIAWLYHSMEKHKDAEVMTKEVLDLQIQTLGKLHRDTLETMNNLALIYSRLGEYAKANELLTEATELTRKLLGNNHPDTLERLGNLVSLYLDQQKLDEATSILVALVDTQTRVAGEEHKHTLSSMHHLAYCLDAQGKGAEAEEIYCKVITIREKVLGNDHPDTLTSRYNLAGGYMVQGQWKKAEDILVAVLEARRGVLGEENKDTLSTMHQLAHCLSEQGQMSEAEEMYSKVITLKTKALGDNHPSTLTSRHNLGSLYADKGQWEEAEAIFVPLVEALKTVLGNDHKNTLAAHQCLEIVQKRGMPSESHDDAEGIEDSSGQSGFDSDDNNEEDKDSGNTSTDEEEEEREE